MVKEEKKGITVKKEQDFSEWYTQVVLKSELIDYSEVSGCYILRPLAYSIWEIIQEFFNNKIKSMNVKNAYFPLLIPEKLLKKESKHILGFKAEVAWVTEAGDSKLDEKLAIRPTSETVMYNSFSKWIRSWRDLPLKLNQWCNIIRWEFKNPMPFIRSREFLWQEGHTAFATKEESDKEVLEILNIYKEIFEDLYAVPVLIGKKSENEKFAGALYSTSVEAFLPNGRAVQGATSHCLGQNFSKAFGIKFLDKNEEIKYAWQNSWGISTRTIGIMVMMHSDDKGLVIPPKIADNKAVIVPIIFEDEKGKILKKCAEIEKKLKHYNVILDDREGYSPGWKFNEWELKGIPVRIEIGPKDIKKKQVILVRRDTGSKIIVKEKDLIKKINNILDDIQKSLFEKASNFLKKSIVNARSLKDFENFIKNKKLCRVLWCNTIKCEENIKEKYNGVKSVNIEFNDKEVRGVCSLCGKDANYYAYFAKSY